MNWTGDIYDERSGEYRIRTQYSYRGAFSTLSYRGKIIGYADGREPAKEKAEAHALSELAAHRNDAEQARGD